MCTFRWERSRGQCLLMVDTLDSTCENGPVNHHLHLPRLLQAPPGSAGARGPNVGEARPLLADLRTPCGGAAYESGSERWSYHRGVIAPFCGGH